MENPYWMHRIYITWWAVRQWYCPGDCNLPQWMQYLKNAIFRGSRPSFTHALNPTSEKNDILWFNFHNSDPTPKPIFAKRWARQFLRMATYLTIITRQRLTGKPQHCMQWPCCDHGTGACRSYRIMTFHSRYTERCFSVPIVIPYIFL